MLGWALVAGFAAVVTLGAMATVILVNAGDSEIPRVTDIAAKLGVDSVQFSWNDPGLQASDAYVVTVDGETLPLQREARATVPAEDGDRVCASVRVARDGKTGDSSAERCVDVSVDIDQGS